MNRQQSEHICSDYVNKSLSGTACLLVALPVPARTPVFGTGAALLLLALADDSVRVNYGSGVLIRTLVLALHLATTSVK